MTQCVNILQFTILELIQSITCLNQYAGRNKPGNINIDSVRQRRP